MSNPENILARYRTYSYHHILIACESTQVAEVLANDTNMYRYMITAGTQRFSKQKAQKNAGDYVVISHGMTDADFIVDLSLIHI